MTTLELETKRTELARLKSDHYKHAITHPMTSECDICNEFVYAIVALNWQIGELSEKESSRHTPEV